MKIHDVTPGTPEWHALRARCRCASEAPVIMNASRHMTRQELVRIKALGLEKEFSDYVREHVLDRGHAIEASARVIVEAQIGEALFPAVVTDDDEVYLASLDGVTMSEESLWECKSANADLVAQVQADKLEDPHYFWQLEHQLMVVPQAVRSDFTVSDGTEQGTFTTSYHAVPGRREELIAAWDQFDEDVKNYVHVDEAPKAIGQKVQATLPTLVVELSGQVIDSNLIQFREAALAIINSVNTNLQDDQDFEDAKEGAKFCSSIEDRVKLVKEQALSKMVTVEEAFKALDDVADAAGKKRRELEALVKSRDASLKAEIIQNGKDAFAGHVSALNTRLGKAYMPVIKSDFPSCIKNKRSFKNMRDAVAGHLAALKIEANRVADGIQINLNYLREHAKDHTALFPDVGAIVLKAHDDLVALATNRITAHKAEEERKAREAEERRQREAQEAEERRLREEAAAKAKAGAIASAQAIVEMANAPLPDPGVKKGFTITPEGDGVPYEYTDRVGAGSNVRPLPRATAAPAKATRPSDDEIIGVLAMHYRVHESAVIGWLMEVNLQAAGERIAAFP